MLKHSIFLIGLSFFVALCISCTEKTTSENTIPISNVDSINYSIDSIHLQNSETVYEDASDTLKLKFDEFEISFPGLYVYSDGKGLEMTDTIELFVELTSKVDTMLINFKTQIKSYTITEQYQTTLSVMDEGPHVELYEWKNYQSEWFNMDSISNGIFLMKTISEEESKRFPKFIKDELAKYLEISEGEKWANIIRKPDAGKWTDQFWIGVGVRRLLLKITLDDGQIISKLLVIYPAMGC